MNQPADPTAGNSAPAAQPFVPEDFQVPDGYEGEAFHLVPLRPEHNERDYHAWSTSVEHIRRTPGFETYNWPVSMTLDENMNDLVQHTADFHARTGFTYSVMNDEDDVIGCVYIYPSNHPLHANVRSWVREDHAQMDTLLYDTVDNWLRKVWPFADFSYAPRLKEYA
ncbi:GNAT family N-acetyltransferase [Streptomyces sp. NPDC021080]|uniref:GNAT family N-acetyltransferase n=1 Tax=Streptomyces sp. NPDC021080 TaxID=3365110 RepID=UPI003796C515